MFIHRSIMLKQSFRSVKTCRFSHRQRQFHGSVPPIWRSSSWRNSLVLVATGLVASSYAFVLLSPRSRMDGSFATKRASGFQSQRNALMDEVMAAYFTLPAVEAEDLPGLMAQLWLEKFVTRRDFIDFPDLITALSAARLAQNRISGLGFLRTTLVEQEHHRRQTAEVEKSLLRLSQLNTWTGKQDIGEMSEDVKTAFIGAHLLEFLVSTFAIDEKLAQLPLPDPKFQEHLKQSDFMTKFSAHERIILYTAFSDGYGGYSQADVRRKLAHVGFPEFSDDEWHWMGSTLQWCIARTKEEVLKDGRESEIDL